jgi:hypothetical protein
MKEKCQSVERELKILGPVSHEDVISSVREGLQDNWKIVKTLPEVIFDLYLDSPDILLCKNEAQLRLRRRKRQEGWTCSFKAPSSAGVVYSARNKIQTRLTYSEIYRFREGVVPGAAPDAAYEAIKASDASADLKLTPTVHLVSFRTRYKIMHPGFKWGDDTAGRQILFLGFEHVSAFDVRNVEFKKFIKHGWLDYSQSLPNLTYYNTELEIRGDEIGMEDTAENFLYSVVRNLKRRNIMPTKTGKYVYSMKELSILS